MLRPSLLSRAALSADTSLRVAEEALTAALPEGWTEHTDASGNSFYFNASTGSSTWEHPLDEYYRSLFLKLKKILVENRAASKVNQSSTLLQCAYRQHMARTAFRIRLGLYRLGQSANVVQAVYRGHVVRSRLREQRMREWLELETFSCSAIQATFRGHRVRRSLAHVRARWAVEQRLRKIVLLQVTTFAASRVFDMSMNTESLLCFSPYGVVIKLGEKRGKKPCSRPWKLTSTLQAKYNQCSGGTRRDCLSGPLVCSESMTACSKLPPSCKARGAATATAALLATCGRCWRCICRRTVPCNCSVFIAAT
jgi:hypothetical protein